MSDPPKTERSTNENLHWAHAISNASRIVPAGYPRSAVFVSDAIIDVPVTAALPVDNTPAAGQRTPRRGNPELMSLRESIFFISG